jgi:hypothetical protein
MPSGRASPGISGSDRELFGADTAGIDRFESHAVTMSLVTAYGVIDGPVSTSPFA